MQTRNLQFLGLSILFITGIFWIAVNQFGQPFPTEQIDESSKEKLRLSHQKQVAIQLVSPVLQSPDGAGEYYAAKRLAKGVKTIPSINYVNAIREKRKYFANHKVQGVEDWQSLGPDFVGGRTRSFIFHPDDPDIMYAGGVSGGVWKTINAGAEWTPIADDLENIAVVTVALIPTQPNILFAGTGEGVYIGRPIVRSRGVEGNGIYRSIDDGVTWQAIEFTLNNLDFRFVNKIRVALDGSIFAATGSGIWRSIDTGDSWELVLDQRDRVGGCHEVEIEPSSVPNGLLISCGSFESAAVYKSDDNGDSWRVVIEEANQGRTTIAYAPSNPNRVYALSAQNQFGPFPYGLNGLYRSEDGGDSWTLISDTNSSNRNNRSILSTTNYVFDCNTSGQYRDGRLAGGGWYYNLIVVDPTNQDRIWTGGLDLWRSDDGGQNFNLGSFWWAPESQASYIHGDHHSLVYHPDYDGINEHRLFASNDGGIWQTTNPSGNTATNNCNPASSFVDWRNLNNNYAVTQFYHGSVARDGQTIIGGSQDNGTQWRAANGVWELINGGDGSYSAIDPKDPSRVFVSSQYANLVQIDILNGQNSATNISNGIEEPGLFITPFVLDPNNNERLWLAGLALWRGESSGQNWVKASSDEFSMNFIDGLSAIAVQPGNSDLVIMGGTDGHIFRQISALSSTRNSNMEKIKISDGYISSINFDRNNPQKVVATVSTFGEIHAWLSEDAGVNWIPLDQLGASGLPDLPTHDIIIAPHDTNTFYVATDIGVYVSEDNGDNWNPLTQGMPNVPVEKLVYNRFNLTSTLFAFTYGRGAFNAILTDITNFAPVALQQSSQLSAVQNESVNFDISTLFDDPNDDLLTYNVDNPPVGITLSSSGEITGSANDVGIFVMNLSASDGVLESNLELTISVTEASEQSSSGGGSLPALLLILAGMMVVLKKRGLIQ